MGALKPWTVAGIDFVDVADDIAEFDRLTHFWLEWVDTLSKRQRGERPKWCGRSTEQFRFRMERGGEFYGLLALYDVRTVREAGEARTIEASPAPCMGDYSSAEYFAEFAEIVRYLLTHDLVYEDGRRIRIEKLVLWQSNIRPQDQHCFPITPLAAKLATMPELVLVDVLHPNGLPDVWEIRRAGD